jgi:hypothetical protein
MSASASVTAPHESEASMETPPAAESATPLSRNAKKKMKAQLSRTRRTANAVDPEEINTGVEATNPAGNEDPPLHIPVRTHRSGLVPTTNPLRPAPISRTGQHSRGRPTTGKDTMVVETPHIPVRTQPHVPGNPEARQDQVCGATQAPPGSRSGNSSRSRRFRHRNDSRPSRRSGSELSDLQQSTMDQILKTVTALAAVQEATNRRLLLLEKNPSRQNNSTRDIPVPSIERSTNRRPRHQPDVRDPFHSHLFDAEAPVMSGANQDEIAFAETTRDHVTDKRSFRFHSDVPPPRGETVFTVRTDAGSLQAHPQKSQRTESIAKLDGGDFDTHRFRNWKADIVSRLSVNHDLYNTELSRMALIWGCTHEDGLARAILSPRYNHPNPAIKFQHWEEMMDALNERLLSGAEVAIERRKFNDLQMNSKETIQQFATRFMQLAIGGEVADSEWFIYFWEKLRGDVQIPNISQKASWNNNFGTMTRALITYEVERSMAKTAYSRSIQPSSSSGFRKSNNTSSGPSYPSNTRTAAEPVRSSSMFPKPGSFGSTFVPGKDSIKPPQRPTAKTGSEPACYNCGKPGHYKPNCPQAPVIKLLDEEGEEAELSAPEEESEEIREENDEA